jgi:hypothetical protein
MEEKEYFNELENGISKLPKEEQGKVFRGCAVSCVKDTVMKEMRRQFDECGGSLDAQYTKYGKTEYFFARIIIPGHVYEMGYPRCFCPMVASGFAKSAVHCQCSRQSILYVLNNLLPDKEIEVETLSTVLSGASECTFRVAVK